MLSAADILHDAMIAFRDCQDGKWAAGPSTPGQIIQRHVDCNIRYEDRLMSLNEFTSRISVPAMAGLSATILSGEYPVSDELEIPMSISADDAASEVSGGLAMRIIIEPIMTPVMDEGYQLIGEVYERTVVRFDIRTCSPA